MRRTLLKKMCQVLIGDKDETIKDLLTIKIDNFEKCFVKKIAKLTRKYIFSRLTKSIEENFAKFYFFTKHLQIFFNNIIAKKEITKEINFLDSIKIHEKQ